MVATKNHDAAFVRKLKKFAADGYAFDSKHKLRKGTQREAYDAYARDFAAGHRHGYFEIPTGVGKTALFISLAKNYIDAVNGEQDGPRTLIVVPSEKLAVQTAQSFAKFMPEIAPLIEADDDKGQKIDWENGDIGLQYSKAKHAEHKPRVLITTYQSLIRDYENKIYPPKEYGMVIYDEGHNLTAKQYGQTVDKFQNAIQLAVSATPEYSEVKTVAERLPHRYYHLSIADAINRGDLCNVRPVLLKTNYTINKQKFKEYVEKRRGTSLTDAQLSSLLNEQTRNRAAMETYLLGRDPDSKERYLGQNGMIFCGSTDHVDDFARQFNELLTGPTYRPVRQWLNEEEIELIAPVHGKVKGTLLRKGLLTNGKNKPLTEGRHYEGNKEWYSEEEIFDLHAKGKILLLASVKKLKEGYDSPRDSIVIDTVDRLSKVDATQIVGRGFRLNPPNPDYNDPGDDDKTCTVINMVDKNTHELYADDPQMLPIYCTEIIDGAEFRKPASRKHLIQRFKKAPPELDADMNQADFKLETDIERVREVSAKNKKARDESESPKLPADKTHWIPATMLRGCMAVKTDTKPHNAKLLQEACTALLSEPNQTWELPKDKFSKARVYKTSEVMGRYHVEKDMNTTYFDPRMAPHIRQQMGLAAVLPDERKHWIAAGISGCSKIGIERKKEFGRALSNVCKALIGQKTVGKYRTSDVVGLYTNRGQDQIYYFDPRLIKDGLITKDMIKDEAKRIVASGEEIESKAATRPKSLAHKITDERKESERNGNRR